VYTMALIPSDSIRNFFVNTRANLRIFWRQVGIGCTLAFILLICMGIYQAVLAAFHVTLANETTGTWASVVDNIVSINRFYNPMLGFLFVVVLVPFYEEVLFRGIFLSTVKQSIPFVWANMAQSLVFAVLHQKPMLIPFYFAFGMLAGHFARKTGSLVPGIALHMTNNLFAFLSILFVHR